MHCLRESGIDLNVGIFVRGWYPLFVGIAGILVPSVK